MRILAAFTSLLVLFFASAASAATAEPKTADEIQECMKGNQPGETSVQTIGMFATNNVGSTTESRAKMFWKRFDDGLSKLLMRFSDPPDLAGAAVLMIERPGGKSDMWMYLPELNKTKRITGHMISGSMFGLDFSWDDFRRIQGIADHSAVERLADEKIGGRSVYVLTTTPEAESGSKYERIVEYIDHDTCVLLRSEMFEPGDRLRRVFEIDPNTITPLGDDGKKWYATEILARDLRDETHTRIAIEQVELGISISQRTFSQRGLESAGR